MVVLTDGRKNIREYFDQVNANCKVLDSNLTDELGNQVKYTAVYERQQIPVEKLFIEEANRIVFVITDRGRDSIDGAGDRYRVGVQPVILDRWTSTGTLSTRATVLMWKAEQEISRVLRANAIGSVRIIGAVTPATELVNSTLLWGIAVEVTYIQWVTEYLDVANTLSNRRFSNLAKEWRVGVNSGTYSCVTPASGVLYWFEHNDPDVKLTVPAGQTPVFQSILNPDIEGEIQVRDYEAITQLCWNTVIDGSNNYACKNAAGTVISRYTIGYMALVVYNTKIVNATDARTSETSSFVFTGARIGSIKQDFESPGAPWTVKFKATKVTQTDA